MQGFFTCVFRETKQLWTFGEQVELENGWWPATSFVKLRSLNLKEHTPHSKSLRWLGRKAVAQS